jgi:hypothetical protein
MRKDVSSVSPEQSSQGKRQHIIEVCNFIDAGTGDAPSWLRLETIFMNKRRWQQ